MPNVEWAGLAELGVDSVYRLEFFNDFGADASSFGDFDALLECPITHFGEVYAFGSSISSCFWWIVLEVSGHPWNLLEDDCGDRVVAFVANVEKNFFVVPNQFLGAQLDVFFMAKVAKFHCYIFISHDMIIFIQRLFVKVFLGIPLTYRGE